MKKYKLIKEYPGSAKLGTIYKDDGLYLLSFAKETEFFEEVKEMPEYVKCISRYGNALVGDVFDTSDDVVAQRLFGLSWENVLVTHKNLGFTFEAITKEQYDKGNREEIKNHLTAEAKKRYLVGDKYISADNNDRDDDPCTLKDLNNLSYYPESKGLTDGWGGYIYFQGKWAERIEESIEIAGYRAKFHDGNVTFGCKGYSKSEVNELIRIMERFDIAQVLLNNLGVERISYDTIRKIRDRIK